MVDRMPPQEDTDCAAPTKHNPRLPDLCDCTQDAFLGGRLSLYQPKSGYRAGLDAVLLASSLDADKASGSTLLDVGAGVGAVGLCAAARVPGIDVILLEREQALVTLAQANIEQNKLGARVTALQASVGAPAAELNGIGLQPETFSHVVANPPFFATGSGTKSPSDLKSAAHTMDQSLSLDDWVRFMARMAKPGGTLAIIHKADALTELLTALSGRFGALRVLPVHSQEQAPAIRLIVMGKKGSKAPPALLPGLLLHQADGSFRPEIDAILRHGAGLDAGLQ